MVIYGPIWLDIGPIWSDLVPKVVKNSQHKMFPRNVPKLIGNGSYSLWGSWEPVFLNVFLYQYKGPFFPIIYYPYSAVKFPIPALGY